MSNSQYLILNDGFKNIKNSLNKNHILMIYCNTFFSFSIFIILIVIASQLSPVVNDAGILINDASKDNTLEIMERFAAQDGRVHTVNVENNEAFWGNKKYALTLGIKRAINKHMFL